MRCRSVCGLLFALVACAALADSPPTRNWPSFRGPDGNGHTTATGLPLKWSETENVKWKTASRGRAGSSRGVWKEQIGRATARREGREMYAVCVEKNTGRILHDKKLFENAKPDPIADINSYNRKSTRLNSINIT